MKIQSRAYHSDVIMSVITFFVVGGLVYTGLNALKEGELPQFQRECSTQSE
ncbi:MAG: hypothetical protein NT124_00600 [Candidatus Dependentiae bacterium]|nr:hypothetical protein [Candidatus Dependentiae bacterium]